MHPANTFCKFDQNQSGGSRNILLTDTLRHGKIHYRPKGEFWRVQLWLNANKMSEKSAEAERQIKALVGAGNKTRTFFFSINVLPSAGLFFHPPSDISTPHPSHHHHHHPGFPTLPPPQHQTLPLRLLRPINCLPFPRHADPENAWIRSRYSEGGFTQLFIHLFILL